MKTSLVVSAAFLFSVQVAFGQAAHWLTDEQARDAAVAAIHAVHPEPCYSTYRNERLESLLVTVRRKPIVGDHLNDSVYFYRVASDSCYYVVEKDGKSALMSQISMDCCEHGTVAVDRATSKSYWFAGREKADVFQEFVRDEELRPDEPRPTLFMVLYRELVWGESGDSEIRSLGQLRDAAQQNFESAYSPYERDNVWKRHFERWWRKFRSQMPHLQLETTYEPTNEGTTIRGYVFNGFELTIPRSGPPPKGTPRLCQWAILIRSDGLIEPLPSKVIYSAR